MIKNTPANAGDIRDAGLTPGLGRSLAEGNSTHSSTLACKIPWTEEPGGLQSMGSLRVRHDLTNKLPQIRNTDSEYRVSFAKGEGSKERKYWGFGVSR